MFLLLRLLQRELYYLHYPHAGKLPDAKPLLFYVETIKETAKQFDIPVLDLYHTLGIDPHNEEQRLGLTVDGLQITPGSTQLTVIPDGPSSFANEVVSPRRAALDAE